jgi:predicted CopG family antitoxin
MAKTKPREKGYVKSVNIRDEAHEGMLRELMDASGETSASNLIRRLIKAAHDRMRAKA